MSRRSAFGCALEIVETVVLTALLFFAIQAFVAQPFQVEQHSMQHTLEPDDFVLVDKLTPRFDPYKRGDIVVFTPPETWVGDGTPYVKRVIGIAGDTIELLEGRVVVNGTAISEPYLYAEDGEAQTTEAVAAVPLWTVPSGEVFLMGDHRKASVDSRAFGPVPVSAIIGRAWLRYWPITAFGVLATPTYPELGSPS